MANAPAPLFRDPIYNGAADPVIVWNRQERCWWILYTNRRASVDTPGVAWVHGTDIGIASTRDHGTSWKYRGIANFEPFEPGRNTYWAPEIIWANDAYHAYVSYVPGVPTDWNDTRHIVHYTSKDLWNWKFESKLNLSSNRVIDACVYRRGSGPWKMWYKDEGNHSHSYLAESDNLFDWRVVGPAITDCGHEGPNVFEWRGHCWMITDPWDGLGVYRSPDLTTWERQANILKEPGTRPDDNFRGSHADIEVNGDNAYIFYFVHPGAPEQQGITEFTPYDKRRTSLQVAKLSEANGVLTCDRNAPFELKLIDGQ